MKYKAHINVEIVASVGAVKYLYKYINKGADRVMVETSNDQLAPDEIQSFVDARYISASEPTWRLNSFQLSHPPSVRKLPIHLQNEQMICIHELQHPAVANSEKTQLTEFFTLNRVDPNAKHLYIDILRYYI